MNTFKKFSSIAVMFSLIAPVAVFAENTQTPTTPPVAPAPTTIAYNPSCASAAVIAQENSIQALHDAFNASVKTAAIAQRDALGAAFLLTDQSAREAAIRTAREAFRAAQKTAEQTMKTAAKALMETFKTTMDACGAHMRNPQDDHNDAMNSEDGDGNHMKGDRGNSAFGHKQGQKNGKSGKNKNKRMKENKDQEGDHGDKKPEGQGMMSAPGAGTLPPGAPSGTQTPPTQPRQ